MRRGELWLAEVGGNPRPVLVVTRDEVIDLRANVTVAEVTTRERGLDGVCRALAIALGCEPA